ncbi:MAG: ribbon-helix-helix domain-containing protein [Phycisphaerae bacterium]
MGRPHRETVVTIRMDQCLADMLKSVPNRSAFIRDAIREALARQCPVCGAAGFLAASGPAAPKRVSAAQADQQAGGES